MFFFIFINSNPGRFRQSTAHFLLGYKLFIPVILRHDVLNYSTLQEINFYSKLEIHILKVPIAVYSINKPTNALIKKLHSKTLKLLRHVSVLRLSSARHIFLAKVTLTSLY